MNNPIRNKFFALKDERFIQCCLLADIKPTSRQASKFRQGKGVAFKMKGKIIRQELIKEGIIRNEN